MLKIITKSAHNALLYQIEDLKKKLADGLRINDEIFNDLIAKNDTIRKQNHKISELENSIDLIIKESETNRTQLTRCSQRHKSSALRNEKLQKANTSLLSKNESLTAENHRLGNLLQVKCDEVKTLERKVKEVEKEEKLSTDIIGEMEYHILHALKSIDVPATRKPKNVMHAIKLLRDALKPLQEIN